MRIEVSLTPALYPHRTLHDRHATVAIDLLRATTAVCAAFQAGCEAVAPLDSVEALERYRRQGYRIAAERGGKKLPGSDYGNSPTEYMRQDMRGVRLAYSTTNGTVCMLRAADAALTLVGAFANLDALCDRLRQAKMDVVLLCSGWQNDFCLEDTLVAGAVIENLLTHNSELITVGDAANMALALWRAARGNPLDYCAQASHVHRLQGFGAEADIRFAFRLNSCPVVPVLRNGLLTL